MCDTLGIIGKSALFAKNSDRHPNEPQLLEFHPAEKHKQKILKVTNIEVEQAEETYSVLVSRPSWMWGAEMGVNECGVAIGNEAVFTKGEYGKTGLLGMDLLRLALERADSAQSAVNAIVALLERYGQGGNCGYGGEQFFYDNSFLIMDRNEVCVLETKDKEWVYKKSAAASISNGLTIGLDGTKYSGDPVDFAKKYIDPVRAHFSTAEKRRCQTAACLKEDADVKTMFRALRTHASEFTDPLSGNSLGSPCMHAGGVIGSQTTGSMVVKLNKEIEVWATGCSTPCVSLFKPYRFGNEPTAPVFQPNDEKALEYWKRREKFFRSLIGKKLPEEYYAQRDALEDEWLSSADTLKFRSGKLSRDAANQEEEFLEKWENNRFAPGAKMKRYFIHYWEKKNAQSGLYD